jgi:hypothetical protein
MNDLESNLSRLGRETERLGPRAGFAERVLVAVDRDAAPSFGAGVLRFGRTMLGVAALCAIGGVTIGLASEHAADEALATTFGAEELDW